MHHRIDDVYAAILGVFGFGIAWTNIDWADIIPKIIASSCIAFMGGLLGYIGKVVGAWCIRKVKFLIHKQSNKP